jgi:hypothetical protein
MYQNIAQITITRRNVSRIFQDVFFYARVFFIFILVALKRAVFDKAHLIGSYLLIMSCTSCAQSARQQHAHMLEDADAIV